jgi:hypothetical protein
MMKHLIGPGVVLPVLVILLTACRQDFPEKAGVFFIESDTTYEYPESANVQPRNFRGSVPAIEGRINDRHNLGVVGSITNGKLRLVLPARIEDECLDPVPNGGDLRRGKFGFSSGAILVLARHPDFRAELFYYNRDAPDIPVKKGWNFKYREPERPSRYIYTNNIETLYAPGEGYQWLVIIPGAK